MNSNSTRRARRAHGRLISAVGEVRANGRAASAVPLEEGSFWMTPVDAPKLAALDDGVAAELRRHLRVQGLHALSESVDDLEKLGRTLRRKGPTDHSVSELVYQMH